MNLASNTAPVPCTRPSRVAPIHLWTGCLTLLCTSSDAVAAGSLVPGPVEVLCGRSKLNDQLTTQINRLDLTSLLSPEPREFVSILSHDDPRIGSSYE